MTLRDRIYRDLQKHLDRQPVGFPAVRSGADIRLLKHFFTPDEVPVVLLLNHTPRTVSRICAEAPPGAVVSDAATVRRRLEAMAVRLVIGRQEVDGEPGFHTIPLVVGMYEGRLDRLTPEFVRDFDAYTSERAFGLAFLSTALPQMRTIPVGRSIRVQHQVAAFDRISHLIEAAGRDLAILPCICRRSAAMKERPCRVTAREETCLALGNVARSCLGAGTGRTVEPAEALAIIRENESEGLVLQPSNTRRAAFICSCCGCCCGMLRVHRVLPRPLEFWATNHRARVDVGRCTGCGVCVARCQVKALRLEADGAAARVNPDRCLGCGQCVAVCPVGALELEIRRPAVRPPATTDDLYEAILDRKKGRLGRLGVAAKIVLRS